MNPEGKNQTGTILTAGKACKAVVWLTSGSTEGTFTESGFPAGGNLQVTEIILCHFEQCIRVLLPALSCI